MRVPMVPFFLFTRAAAGGEVFKKHDPTNEIKPASFRPFIIRISRCLWIPSSLCFHCERQLQYIAEEPNVYASDVTRF